MKKRNLWYILDSIFLIAFNSCFFLLKGTHHPSPIWISYGFIHLAYFVLLFTPYFIRKGSASADYGRPLFVITYAFFYVSYYTGVINFFVYPSNYTIPLVAHIMITVVFLFFFISNLLANEYTADSIERRELELQYIKESSSKLKSILNKVSDKSLSNKIESVYDTIHGSPSKSTISVSKIEKEIIELIQNLETAVLQNDKDYILSLSNRILNLAEERNRLLKLSN
jgi:signal transduction histidine kinase